MRALPLALLCLACGAMDEAAFSTSCTASCVAGGTAQAQCQTYCDCGYTWAREHDRVAELQHIPRPRLGQRMSPLLEDIMAACGSEIYDGNFRRECVRSCSLGDICRERCDCFLRELRGPGPREESTRFMLVNLDVDPPTTEGEARIDAAELVCPP